MPWITVERKKDGDQLLFPFAYRQVSVYRKGFWQTVREMPSIAWQTFTTYVFWWPVFILFFTGVFLYDTRDIPCDFIRYDLPVLLKAVFFWWPVFLVYITGLSIWIILKWILGLTKRLLPAIRA